MVVSAARHSEGFLAVRLPGDQAWLIPNGRDEGGRLLNAFYYTGMFSRFDSSDTRRDDSFDETLHALGRALESLGEKDINACLSHLAVDGKVSSSTQNQALAALLFLFRQILGTPVGELGRRADARCRGPQIYQGSDRVAVAVRLPAGTTLEKRRDRPTRPLPHGRVTHAKGSPYRRPQGRHRQTRELPYLSPLIRDPSHRKRLRHQDRPGASRPQRREDHHDLYARAQPGTFGSEEPDGPILRRRGYRGSL